MKKQKINLTIGWLYPDLMSTYGDRGNISCLTKRCEWRGIEAGVLRINTDTKLEKLEKLDLIFGGGAEDRQQEIVMRDLKGSKGKIIKGLTEKGIPALFVCGAPQLMGKYYEPGFGKRIEGLGIFDMISIHPGLNEKRLIGNIVAKTQLNNFRNKIIVGFENHGGKTYLGKKVKPFASVLYGNGNNGKDKTEGVVYKSAIGCYFHGPLLPKNPEIADYLIEKALENKYGKEIKLKKLDDFLAQKARETILRRYNIA